MTHLEKTQVNIDLLHKKYNSFLSAPLGKRIFFYIKEIVSLLGFYILMKICWYVPTWLLLIVVCEGFVFWDVLEEKRFIEKAGNLVVLAKDSIQHVFGMIPKYQGDKKWTVKSRMYWFSCICVFFKAILVSKLHYWKNYVKWTIFFSFLIQPTISNRQNWCE